MSVPGDDDDVYLNKLQTRDVKKSILYRWNVDYSQ
jgi:folate-binding Fe-S cluster repair protein YgfZ